MDILKRRIDVILRRNREKNVFQSGDLRVDLDKKQISIQGRPVKVTAKEYRLLECLIQNRGQVLTKETLLQKIWDMDGNFVEENTLYSGGILAAGKKRQVSSKRDQISVMAWRNIFRSRKNALITLVSLLLWFMIALSSVVIIHGIDYRNELEQKDDFELLALSAPFFSEGYQGSDICFEDSFCEKIEQMDGIYEKIERYGCCSRSERKRQRKVSVFV